ncbi:piwi-like protein 1 isoform X1 [Clavelina lepadiformis]|uniref:piwi-like protein 1 isoform X1 n=2 Tax=Clavelina lepadiformis TaxID=159417 RepID=UPI00404157FC
MEEQTRARGRARGRGRGAPPDGDGPRAPVRPGGSGAKELAPAAQAGPSGEHALPSRGVRRGALQPREGGVAEATRGVAGMALARRPGILLGKRSNFDPSLFDPKTKPEHITDKRGSGGKPVDLITNFFPLGCSRNWVLYQYRVDFNPEVDHKGARKGMLRDHTELLGPVYMFDGTMLFTTRKLPQKETEVFSKRRTDGSNIRITISLTNELSANSPVSVQIYNILFRWVLEKIGMKQVGRNYYNPTMACNVQCGNINFEIWPGFVTSILQYERNVLLCAEISHKLMRKDTVLDILYQISADCKRSGRNVHDEAQRFLVGQIVLTRYNNNTYRIDGIEWGLNPSKTFERRGTSISYAEYYKEQYNIQIKELGQPLLLSRPKKREIRRGGLEVIHLIPELSTVTGLTDELRADFHTMKKLGNVTKQSPQQRADTLNRFIRKITGNDEIKQKLSEWGLRFDNDLVKLQGRVLDPEQIVFQNKTVTGGHQASWDREMRDAKLVRSINLSNWFFIHVARDRSCASDLAKKLCQVSIAMGFKMAHPTMVEATDDRTDQYQRIIKDVLSRNKNTQMILCLLPSSRKDRYDAIKKLCCVDYPVPSQVVLAKTLSKPQRVMSIATKIAIQMNCKLGGEAWAVKIPLRQCMIIGIDTYHDSAQKGRSVGGFVASINSNYTRWYSNVTFQHSGGELIDGLKRCMMGALAKFRQMNGCLPMRIIIFRDGVGDGQLEMVKDHEIPQLLQCLQSDQSQDYKPNVTFVVVKKRVNARFFNRVHDRLQNPSPGTVIDDVITRPDWYDFFVVSQSVREGTVTPTHYNVIYDTSTLKPDHMQKLAYKLCHLYYNWPGTIRVPAPCLYAHKLAFLIGQSVHQPVSATLQDKLYFL